MVVPESPDGVTWAFWTEGVATEAEAALAAPVRPPVNVSSSTSAPRSNATALGRRVRECTVKWITLSGRDAAGAPQDQRAYDTRTPD